MVAALDALRQLDLLRRGQQVDLADVLQEELERVGRDVGRVEVERVLFGLFLDRHDLDVQLLEHAVELVDLGGVERQLVKHDRDLLGRQLSGLSARLQKLPRLLRLEDGPLRPSTCYDLLPSRSTRFPSRSRP